MRLARLAGVIAITLVAIQLGPWAIIGRRQLARVAAESFFGQLQARAIENGWDRDSELPPNTLEVAKADATALGSRTVSTLRSVAEEFNQAVELVDYPEGDKFCYVETVNTPVFARIEIGWLGKGCSLIGTTDYMYLAGFWIELPRD